MKNKNEFMKKWKKYQKQYFEGKINDNEFLIVDEFFNFLNNLLESETIRFEEIPNKILDLLDREA